MAAGLGTGRGLTLHTSVGSSLAIVGATVIKLNHKFCDLFYQFGPDYSVAPETASMHTALIMSPAVDQQACMATAQAPAAGPRGPPALGACKAYVLVEIKCMDKVEKW